VIDHGARLALIVGALTSFAWSAHAQEGVRTRSTDVDDLGTLRYNDRRFESPQHVALEFRVGRYVPDVDSEFTTATPYETTFGSDNRDDLPNVKARTLVLQCSQDVIAPRQVGEYVHRNIPGSELKYLEATGHCPNLSAPGEVIAAIRGFI